MREPLAVGMVLRSSDRVVSGDDARIVLRMPEGSLVKLGSQAQLALDRLGVQREPDGTLVTAALDVLRGAFRFTTQAATRFRGRRQIDVRIATITAGIRGTDVWGKAADDRDIVCLIEGRISVQRGPRRPSPWISRCRSISRRRTNRRCRCSRCRRSNCRNGHWRRTCNRVRAARIATVAGGSIWRVARTQAEALALYDRLREAGYPAQIRPVKDDEGYAYAIAIRHLADEAEAAALAARLKNVPGVAEPRIVRG